MPARRDLGVLSNPPVTDELLEGQGRASPSPLIFGWRGINGLRPVSAEGQEVLLGQVDHRAPASSAAAQDAVEYQFAAVHTCGVLNRLLRALSRFHCKKLLREPQSRPLSLFLRIHPRDAPTRPDVVRSGSARSGDCIGLGPGGAERVGERS